MASWSLRCLSIDISQTVRHFMNSAPTRGFLNMGSGVRRPSSFLFKSIKFLWLIITSNKIFNFQRCHILNWKTFVSPWFCLTKHQSYNHPKMVYTFSRKNRISEFFFTKSILQFFLQSEMIYCFWQDITLVSFWQVCVCQTSTLELGSGNEARWQMTSCVCLPWLPNQHQAVYSTSHSGNPVIQNETFQHLTKESDTEMYDKGLSNALEERIWVCKWQQVHLPRTKVMFLSDLIPKQLNIVHMKIIEWK